MKNELIQKLIASFKDGHYALNRIEHDQLLAVLSEEEINTQRSVEDIALAICRSEFDESFDILRTAGDPRSIRNQVPA